MPRPSKPIARPSAAYRSYIFCTGGGSLSARLKTYDPMLSTSMPPPVAFDAVRDVVLAAPGVADVVGRHRRILAD